MGVTRERLVHVRWTVVVVPALILANAVLALRLDRHGGSKTTILLVAAPLAVVGLGALVASRREVLVYVALGLNLSFSQATSPLPLPGPRSYLADWVAILAIVSWAFARLLHSRNAHGSRAAVVGWPFVLFSVAILQAVIRGHEHYGISLHADQTRFVVYAAIAFALTDSEPKKLYRGIVGVFYVGTVWMLINAAYYVATGRSQTGAVDVSTGGSRYLANTTAMYLAVALFLALLNLQVDRSAKRRFLHVGIIALASIGIVLALGRATFLAIGIVVPLLVIASPRVRSGLLSILPLCAPLLVLVVLLVPRVVPSIGPELFNRLTASPSSDTSVKWRVAAVSAVWPQFKESPWVGVGFGRQSRFFVNDTVNDFTFPVEQTIVQDPHNGYIYLLVAGGVFALGTFVLLILAFLRQVRQGLKLAREPEERVLLIWSVLALFAFLVNAASGLTFDAPASLLTIWTLLVLPSVVVAAHEREEARGSRRQLLFPSPA